MGKKRYSKTCKAKKEAERRKWEEYVSKVNSEAQIWKLVNQGRKKKENINKEIKVVEWDEHFRKTLGGVEKKREIMDGCNEGMSEDLEEDIALEEIRDVAGKLKDFKDFGEDRIPNEVWKYGGENVLKELWRICQRV